MALQVWQVLQAFEPVRRVYERIRDWATTAWHREVAKNVVCLLLWLDMIAGVRAISGVAAMGSNSVTLARVVEEAFAVHSFVTQGIYWLPRELERIPTLVALCGGGRLVDFRFFRFHRDLVARGLAMVANTVAPLVFSDELYVLMRQFQNESGSSANWTPRAPELLQPFVLQTMTPPQDSRTVFAALPEQHPHSAQEILESFRRAGLEDRIESIRTEQALPWETHRPKHAAIVFSSVQTRDQTMGNQTAIICRLNGRDIWMQRYKPLC